MSDERRWLLVSKPLRPPFRDGSTVMVRSLVLGLPAELPVAYLGDPRSPLRARDRVIKAPPMGYAPSLPDKARVLGTLVDPRHLRFGLHFFFTPNRVSSTVLAGLRRLQPWRKVVQTVTSSEGIERSVPLLRRLDAVVVASRRAAIALHDGGLRDDRVHRIAPGVDVPHLMADRGPIPGPLLYAGDLDGPVVRRLVAIGRMLRRPELAGWTLTIAVRPKGEGYERHRTELSRSLDLERAAGRVRLLGEVSDMDALLRATSLQLFLADHVRNKVDLPLVVLEGMARGVGVFAVAGSAIGEIFTEGQELGLRPGVLVSPSDPETIARSLAEALTNPDAIRSFGTDAHELCERAFSTDNMVRRYAELYRGLEAPRGHIF